MERKHVIFVADSLDNAYKFQRVLSGLDVEISAGSSAQFEKFLAQKLAHDLVVYEVHAGGAADVAQLEQLLVGEGSTAVLLIVSEAMLPELRLPVQVKSDFVLNSAGDAECAARVRQLLWPGNESSAQDLLVVDSMTVNLATYQVTVNGNPLDLTYLEYALLAFLASHPGRTYSRDALLRRVWGFEYYGGSRTVDVHVRRIRAKLGPEMAQHLETVRGVGYLWTA